VVESDPSKSPPKGALYRWGGYEAGANPATARVVWATTWVIVLRSDAFRSRS
jgi:hypothetical protein